MSKNVLFGRFAQKPLTKFVRLLNKLVKLYLKFFLDFDKIIKIMNIEVVFMSKTYVKNGKYCVVNNTYEPQDTTVYLGDGTSFDLHLEANEIKWYQI